MLSKPINPNTMFNTHMKTAAMQKNSIVYNDFTISDYTNNNASLTKMKMPELKYICKSNRLHVSGTKPILIDRIHEFYKKYGIAIKIQKWVRGYYVRASFKMRGAAFKNRAICTNTTDFYTMEPLEEISFRKFYSYTDEKNFTYGFDIDSLIELYNKKGRIVNPYNRDKITFQTRDQILRLYRLIGIVYKENDDIEPTAVNLFDHVSGHAFGRASGQVSGHAAGHSFGHALQNTFSPNHVQHQTLNQNNNIITTALQPLNHGQPHGQPENNNQALMPTQTSMPISINEVTGQPARMTEHQLSVIREKSSADRIIAVFMDIDQLGHYTDVSWFNNLDKRQCFQFYREIINIWRFRAQIPYMTKFRICPYDPVSNIFPLLNFETISVDTLKEGCLRVIENMVYMGYDTDHRNLGAYHILTAFTVVSIPARTQMPWLYESIY